MPTAGEVIRMHTLRRNLLPRSLLLLTVLFCLGFAACGGGGGSGEELPPPDLTGVWAGTWEGTDSVFGTVTGTWEAEVQADRDFATVTGAVVLDGDVDCADAGLEGLAGAGGPPAGWLDRSPCAPNDWVLTALDLATRSASGTWTKPATGGAGSFTGTQVATPGGPRIRYFAPRGGPAGTVVTIVGTGLEGVERADLLFDSTPAAAILHADSHRVVAAVPSGAAVGHLFASTAHGVAISPRSFDTRAGRPRLDFLTAIPVGAPQKGVVVSPDGRRAFVASRTPLDEPTVLMVDTATRHVIATTRIAAAAAEGLPALAVSPDGRRLYACAGGDRVTVLHGVSNAHVGELIVPCGEPVRANPHGITVSPDGRLLYVADARDGGGVSVVDLTSGSVTESIPGTDGFAPRGIALSPDGLFAYLAFSSLTQPGEIRVFEHASGSIVSAIPVGPRPFGVARTPDGARLYVSNELGSAVTVIDTVRRQVSGSIPVGGMPSGIAVSPDGTRVLVANGGSQTLTIADTATNQVLWTIPVPGSPVGVAISPDGQRAYVTHSDTDAASELTGYHVLTLAKGGTGIGVVTTDPPGLECGAQCQASFPDGALVRLFATPYSGSAFAGWGGDPDCRDGLVTLRAGLTCTATFEQTGGVSGGGGGAGGGCFLGALTQRP
jgi:YVTN family beta-propeller protein